MAGSLLAVSPLVCTNKGTPEDVVSSSLPQPVYQMGDSAQSWAGEPTLSRARSSRQ